MQAQLTNILGLHHTSSRVSIHSITSFAGSTNTKKAYKTFRKDLYEIGVTADMINQKKSEILNIVKAQDTVISGQMGGCNIAEQNQLLEVSGLVSKNCIRIFFFEEIY